MRIRLGVTLLVFIAALGSTSPASSDHEPGGPLWFSQAVEPGYVVTPFATGAATVTSMAFGPDDDLYVTTFTGHVLRYRSVDGAVAGPPEPVVQGLEAPQGIAWGPDGRLYVTSVDPDRPQGERPWGMVIGFDLQGPAAPPLDVADGERLLVDIPGGVHTVSGLACDPDGLAYVGQGSTTINGFDRETQDSPPEVPNVSLAVLRFDPAEAAEEPLSALRYRGSGGNEDPVDVVATGIHTPQDLVFRGEDLYTASNGPHEQTPLGEEPVLRALEATKVSLADGTAYDFGSPRCLYTHDELGWPVAKPATYPDLENPGCDGVRRAEAVLGLHRGVTGLAFAPEGFGAFGGDLFLAEWGSLPETDTAESLFETAIVDGHKVVRLGITEDGAASATPDGSPDLADFLVGVDPIDIAFHDGAMYVADFGTSTILRVVPAT